MRRVFLSIYLIAICTPVYAQNPQAATAPKTKMEAFTGEVGVVTIKGYTEVGRIVETGTVTVDAMTFRNARTDAESSGIVIEVKSAGAYGSDARSYVDYDEIAGLIEGIDYIAKADIKVTKLKNFEASYSTKGGLKIVVFNQTAGVKGVAVQVGAIAKQAFLKWEHLARMRGLIILAKQTLDGTAPVVAAPPAAAPPAAPPAEPKTTPTAKKSDTTPKRPPQPPLELNQ